MSCVMCHVSHVTGNFFFLFFFLQSGEAYWWRVCYQRGLPLLVCVLLSIQQAFAKLGAALQTYLSIINQVSRPPLPLVLRQRQAQTVWKGESSYQTDYVAQP